MYQDKHCLSRSLAEILKKIEDKDIATEVEELFEDLQSYEEWADSQCEWKADLDYAFHKVITERICPDIKTAFNICKKTGCPHYKEATEPLTVHPYCGYSTEFIENIAGLMAEGIIDIEDIEENLKGDIIPDECPYKMEHTILEQKI